MSNLGTKKRNLSQEDLFNFSELFKLMKPRVMSLVIFTCAVGLLTAPIGISTKDAIIGILLVSIGAGAAGAQAATQAMALQAAANASAAAGSVATASAAGAAR